MKNQFSLRSFKRVFVKYSEQFSGRRLIAKKRERERERLCVEKGLRFFFYFPPREPCLPTEVRKFMGFNDTADWDDEGIEKKRFSVG